MLIQTKMTKTGTPTAFVVNSFKELPIRSFETHNSPKRTISTVAYQIEAFWITSRSNGNMGLAFGRQTFRFITAHDINRSKFQGLTYAQLLDAAQPSRKNGYVDPLKEDFVFEDGRNALIVWDGSGMWSEAATNYKDLIPTILPQLVVAYPQLPTPPAGTDGWYKIKES